MKILGIETSCDETALAIVEADGGWSRPRFKVLAEALNSQTKIHEKYGGVFPMMAKREHGRNLIPLLKELLRRNELFLPQPIRKQISNGEPEGSARHKKFVATSQIEEILNREPELLMQFLQHVPEIASPNIDAIAVTTGPGLEPALWVGINFAKALGIVWNLPVIPTNHMEGHIVSVLLSNKNQLEFPAVALLISGGHTELVLIHAWPARAGGQKYEILGQTRDDAVGEAFDKVARMLELPYPGGPEISRLASEARERSEQLESVFSLPRPMINSDNYDFSFAGLKTAVLYTIRKMSEEQKQSPTWKQEIAKEFEDAVTEVLISKTRRAMEEFGVKTLIVGGGVISNPHLRRSFQNLIKDFPESQLLIPEASLSTDNAVMIAMAGYFNYLSNPKPELNFKATGNLKLVSLSNL